jgi:hypothetical protein
MPAGSTRAGAVDGWIATIIDRGDIIGIMSARRTKVELEAENTRLATEVEALRNFVFEIDLGQANLEARRAALQEFLQQHPAPEPFLPLKKIDADDSGADYLIREPGARVEPRS